MDLGFGRNEKLVMTCVEGWLCQRSEKIGTCDGPAVKFHQILMLELCARARHPSWRADILNKVTLCAISCVYFVWERH